MKDNNSNIEDEKKDISSSNYDAIIKTFITDSEDFNSKNECGWTPLYRTIVAENSEATELLLNMGADPDIKCNMGETALFQAVEMDSLKQVEILLSKGANPNIPQNDGRIPLHSATVKQNLQIVELLLTHGSNPNTQGKLYGQTPVHLAVKNSVKPTILLLLVKNGGSLLIKDKYDKKPTDYVETDEMRDTINMLKLQGEVPETPKKDLLMTPSKLCKKDFLMIAKTLSDQKTRKDFENYITSNNEFHPYNIKINNLKLDDYLFRDNSIPSNNTQNANNNINVIDDYRERDSYVNSNNGNNVSNFNTFGNNNNPYGLNVNNDLEREIMHRKYLSNDINNENMLKKEAFYEMIKQRSSNSINYIPNNSNNNYDNINIMSYPSNFNLNNVSNFSNLSGINNNDNNNNFPILANLNSKANSPFLNPNKNLNSSPLFPFPNLNSNSNNLNFFTNSNNAVTPIHISSDGNNLTKNNVSSTSDSNTLSVVTNIIPRPDNKQTAVNSPNYVKNNGHFERLNSSHNNSANNSKLEINELNKNDSFNAIFSHSNKTNEEIFNNKVSNQTLNTNDNKNNENENDLERKISSKSDLSDNLNVIHYNQENNSDNDLDKSNYSSQNENNYNSNRNNNNNNNKNNNYYFRSSYLPTIESKGSEFESEYERDIKSNKNSFLNNNKCDERLASHENIVNKEFKHSEKEIEDISNSVRFSHEINSNKDLKAIEDVDKCFSQEISRKKNDNFNIKRNQSDRTRKNQSIHTNPIPEIEDDHENEENTSRRLERNERLNEEDLKMDNFDMEDSKNNYYQYNKRQANGEFDKTSENEKMQNSSNSKGTPNSNDDVNYENNGIISDTNPLDLVNPYPSTKFTEKNMNTNSTNNKENYNSINLNENQTLKDNKNITNFALNYSQFNQNVNNNNQNKNNSDSIDEDEETIGNIHNKTNVFCKRANQSKQIFSKEFYDELNFYGSPVNSNAKKSYVVSELNLTSNRKSRESIKKIDLSYKLKNEKLDFSNYSHTNNQNNQNYNKNINLTEVLNSPQNYDNSDINKLNLTSITNQKTARSGSDNNEKKTKNNKNTNSNSMSNNVQNSRSTNNNSESNITNSNAYKKIPNSKNYNLNSNPSHIYSNKHDRPNLKYLDERENLKNYANSFIDPSPSNIDYSSNRIDFNYNSNTKNSPRYESKINQSAFIKTNHNFNYNHSSPKNDNCNQSGYNNISRSNLSPNSQKKLNYFNTDICDISISKRPKHNIDKGLNLNKDSIHSLEEKPTNKFRYNSKLLENEDERYIYEKGNLSTRNIKEYNIFKSEVQSKDSSNRNKKKNEERNKIDFPQTINCFDDFSPKNYNNSKPNNFNSDYLCDDTNITNYNNNFTAYNENCDIGDIDDSCGNNYMNNTVNHFDNKNSKGNQIPNLKNQKNTHNQSYISERNAFSNNRKNFQILNSNNNNISPKSINGSNYNQTIKKRMNRSDFSNINNNKNYPQANIYKNNVYLETLYYGPENGNLEGTPNSAISKMDAKKLHNWLISMNLQVYYNNFVEKGIVDVDQIIQLAANDPENKLTYLDLENVGIRKPGHIFKILTRIEFDAKNIDQNLSFLVHHKNLNRNSVSNSQVNLRMSEAKFICCGFTRENSRPAEVEKPQNFDLIAWLKYVNLPHLRKNFLHNGFDSIEYLILQCFSIYLVDEALLENYMHIYNKSDRRKILSQLAKDLNLINKKICNQSINFNNFDLLTEHENSEKSDPGCKGCTIF